MGTQHGSTRGSSSRSRHPDEPQMAPQLLLRCCLLFRVRVWRAFSFSLTCPLQADLTSSSSSPPLTPSHLLSPSPLLAPIADSLLRSHLLQHRCAFPVGHPLRLSAEAAGVPTRRPLPRGAQNGPHGGGAREKIRLELFPP